MTRRVHVAGAYPSSLVVMVPSPSLSNREKASLNSAICSSVSCSSPCRERARREETRGVRRRDSRVGCTPLFRGRYQAHHGCCRFSWFSSRRAFGTRGTQRQRKKARHACACFFFDLFFPYDFGAYRVPQTRSGVGVEHPTRPHVRGPAQREPPAFSHSFWHFLRNPATSWLRG